MSLIILLTAIYLISKCESAYDDHVISREQRDRYYWEQSNQGGREIWSS